MIDISNSSSESNSDVETSNSKVVSSSNSNSKVASGFNRDSCISSFIFSSRYSSFKAATAAARIRSSTNLNAQANALQLHSTARKL
jgi:hypothetical protein